MAHINVYIMRILNFIKKTKRKFSFREIEVNCGVKVSSVINALKNNPRVLIENDRISYLPEFSIFSREDLKKLLQARKEGIELEKLDDGTTKVSSLLFSAQEMREREAAANNGEKNSVTSIRKRQKQRREEGNKIRYWMDDEFIILTDIDGSEIVFSYDNSYLIPNVSEEIKKLWHSITVLDHQDIVEELKKQGLNEDRLNKKPQTVEKVRKCKKRRARRNIVITNTHIDGLDLQNMDDDDSSN